MYPDLSYFVYDLTGLGPDNVFAIIKTFGLFLAFAVFAAAMVLKLEFKRMEKAGILHPIKEDIVVSEPVTLKDVLINTLIGFFIGFKGLFAYHNFDTFRVDPAGVIFSADGSLLGALIGLLIFGGFTFYKYIQFKDVPLKTETKNIYPHMRVAEIGIQAAIWGVIGSKLFSVLENFGDFIKDPIGEVFSGSGLTIYGGLILAFIVVYRYVKKRGIEPIHMMDAAAAPLVVGYGVGRMGCQFSGDGDWGIVNELSKPDWFLLPDWFWSFTYPRNVLNHGIKIPDCTFEYCHQLNPAVFPTPVWEITAMAFLFLILWSIRKKIKTPGVLFFIYLFFNGVERFCVEFFRVNPRYDFLGYQLSQAQIIAIGLMIISLAAVFILKKRSNSDVKV